MSERQVVRTTSGSVIRWLVDEGSPEDSLLLSVGERLQTLPETCVVDAINVMHKALGDYQMATSAWKPSDKTVPRRQCRCTPLRLPDGAPIHAVGCPAKSEQDFVVDAGPPDPNTRYTGVGTEGSTPPAYEAVDHPPHYNQGDIEHIEYVEDRGWAPGYHLGIATKHLHRAGLKPGADMVEDLKKARFYVDRLIQWIDRGKAIWKVERKPKASTT